MTVLAVVGSRACNAAQFAAIMRNLDGIEPAPERIVTGDAAGVDEAARFWARENIGPAVVHAADWAAHGPAAGPLRNTCVVADADQLIAFVCRRPSPGTEDAIRQAKRAGIAARVFDLSGVA